MSAPTVKDIPFINLVDNQGLQTITDGARTTIAGTAGAPGGAAPGVGKRHAISCVSISNTGATSGEVVLYSGTTAIWPCQAPTDGAGGGSNHHFIPPLRCNENEVFAADPNVSVAIKVGFVGWIEPVPPTTPTLGSL